MLMNILAITLPTLTVLVGILLNQNGLNRLDARINALETSLRGEMKDLRGEMKALETGLRGEMKALETGLRGEMAALRTSFHSDVVMLMERDARLEQRVARLERAS